MVINDFILEGILNKHMLSIEYDVQQILEHEILVEASASRTAAQKDSLKDLFDKARATIRTEGTSVSCSLSFLSVPKGMEEYAEILKQNSMLIVSTVLKDKISELVHFDDVQEEIRNYVKQWAIDQIRSMVGGVS